MNLASFFEKPPQEENHAGTFTERREFNQEQLAMLEKMRASKWLQENIRTSSTNEKEDLNDISHKMDLLGLHDEDFDYFQKNYNKFHPKDVLH